MCVCVRVCVRVRVRVHVCVCAIISSLIINSCFFLSFILSLRKYLHELQYEHNNLLNYQYVSPEYEIEIM